MQEDSFKEDSDIDNYYSPEQKWEKSNVPQLLPVVSGYSSNEDTGKNA